MYAEEQAKAERRERFMERERKMRAAVRGVDPAEAKGESKRGDSKYSKEDKEIDFEAELGEDAAPPKTASSHKSKKPMWAMTEDKAEKAQDEEDEEEAEQLLDFAAGLDFDKFIDDMEVRAMMEQVKGRVDELESAIAQEERVAETLCKEKAERVELTNENLGRFEEDYDEDEQRKDDDLISIAENMLSQRGMNQTYSKQAMIEKVAQVKNSTLDSISEDGGRSSALDAHKKYIAEQSQKNADARATKEREAEDDRRRAEAAVKAAAAPSVDASNLPYLHRNPAV